TAAAIGRGRDLKLVRRLFLFFPVGGFLFFPVGGFLLFTVGGFLFFTVGCFLLFVAGCFLLFVAGLRASIESRFAFSGGLLGIHLAITAIPKVTDRRTRLDLRFDLGIERLEILFGCAHGHFFFNCDTTTDKSRQQRGASERDK
ncbi:MAG: hypothetical protein QF805_29465, partial [Pirellulaceae bacterium]|nr:hypothetical protein [Pirellulaceae bacterium]